MPERTESKAVERSCWFYQRLLKIYPRAHREEYGGAMSQLFRDQCRDAWNTRRTRGVLVCWLRALSDLLKTSVLEHLSNLNRKKSMLKLFRPQFRPLAVFFSVFAAVFLLTLLASALMAFITPESFRSTSQIIVDASRLPSQAAPDPYYLQTEFKVIQSHAVLSKVVDTLNLRDLWGKKFNNGQSLKESDAEGIILHNLELQPIRNTKIIKIRVFSDNPDEAARLANGIAEAYRAYTASLADSAATPRARMVTIIQPAIPELRPVRPNRPLMLAVGIVIGGVLGSIAGAVSVGMVTLIGRNRNTTLRPAM